jgi:hypothetical protein
LGYEIGKGDPVATGLGAAVRSYLGNGIAGKQYCLSILLELATSTHCLYGFLLPNVTNSS